MLAENIFPTGRQADVVQKYGRRKRWLKSNETKCDLDDLSRRWEMGEKVLLKYEFLRISKGDSNLFIEEDWENFLKLIASLAILWRWFC